MEGEAVEEEEGGAGGRGRGGWRQMNYPHI